MAKVIGDDPATLERSRHENLDDRFYCTADKHRTTHDTKN
jgi:hypothetical protein